MWSVTNWKPSVLQKKNIEIHIQCFLLGAYAPLTMEGNIIVDGVLASCYASTQHDLAHIGMAPMRWFPQIMELIFGENNGNHVYVKIAKEFGHWGTSSGLDRILDSKTPQWNIF